MPESESKSAESPKPKRKYTRRATVAAQNAIPEAPNPRIADLETQIIELVGRRAAVLKEISVANTALAQAQIRAASAKDEILQLDQEVQYRMSLIDQMKGRQPTVVHGPSGVQQGMTVIPGGFVGSVPSSTTGIVTGIDGRRVRSESAEGVRAEEVAARSAY